MATCLNDPQERRLRGMGGLSHHGEHARGLQALLSATRQLHVVSKHKFLRLRFGPSSKGRY